MKLYIGIDLGTSGCRAVAIDETAAIRARASRSLPRPETPLRNQHQQDPEIWWRILCEVLAEIASICGEESPVAIAVDGTSSTLLLADHQGNPLTPALMYNDSRSRDALPLLGGIAPEGNPVLSPSSSLAKLLHLGRTIATERYRALHQADWIAGRLCGDYRHSDENNALKMGYDPISRAWPAWMADLQLAQDALPEVVPSGSTVGRLSRQAADATGLPPGIAIVAGTTDGNAAFLATGARETGEAVTSLGSTLVVKILSEEPVFAAKHGVYSHRLGARWLVSGASNSGGAVLANYFSDDEMARMTRDLQPQRATGLDYYPLLAPGERFPVNDADYPPRLQPRPANDLLFFQGMLEGIANIEAKGYRLLQRLGAARLKHVYSVGGGAKSEPWRQIREQRLRVPVITAAHHEAAYGTALLAMRGAAE
ncbi:MAG: FGGY-family carbohydrate kinase [Candidatus Thiodiazotropha sp.]|nr:FGGY-family carbohydrate kinase [Candidatus Thiodiazotropha sp. (ex Lucina pensylvanica)]